jgi:cytochrome c biogenesis protein CcmG, thiol:disulfide interchange protein DsbE
MTASRRPHRASAALAIACLFAVTFGSLPTALANVSVGDRAAAFRGVQDASGANVTLAAHRGKVVVVTFGASWCAPCRRELPALERLAARYAAQGADVQIIAVNIDRDRATGRRFMSEFGFEHVQAVFDPNSATARLYDPPAMPSTYIIDKRGLVRAIHEGYRPGDENKIRQAVDRLL